jgi:predicted nucleic acid-binding protein
MKSALFDTNIVTDYATGIKPAQNVIRACPHRCISTVTWIEFLSGIPLQRIAQAELFLKENFEILPVTTDTARHAVHLRKNFRLNIPASIIYGTAKSNHLTLITRNTKDFNPEWSDIQIPYSL